MFRNNKYQKSALILAVAILVTIISCTFFVEEAEATTYFYITMYTPYVSGSGVYAVEQGSNLLTYVASPYTISTGVRARCIGYSVDGGGLIAGTSYQFTNVQANHTITYSWVIEYLVTFYASGLDSSAMGTILDYASGTVTYPNLPAIGWYQSGTSCAFTYTSTVSSSTTGKQFQLYSSTTSPQTIYAPTTISATYSIYYYLTVNSAYGTPLYAGWYLAGSTAYCSVTPTTISGGTGKQYVFSSWAGSGSGSYTGSTVTPAITMNAPITETASWQTQYYLTVSGVYVSSTGSGWYNSGATATFSVTSTTAGSLNFTGWLGSGSGSYSGSNNPSQCTMNAAITETAQWGNQYLLTIVSAHGTTTGSGYYEAGSTAYAGLTSSTVSGGTGVRYNFVSWSTGGTNATQSAPITMNSDVTVTATWSTQYYLTVSSAHGLPTSGTNWYNSGAIAYAGINTSVDGDYTFTGWSGGATGSGITSNAITMNAPKTATAQWTSGTTPSGPTSYNVTVSGPYYETSSSASYLEGTPAAGESVQFTLSFANSTIFQHTLTSSEGVADSIYITSTSPFVQLTWNASSTSATLNATRIYRFANGDNGIDDSIVYLYILDPDTPAYQYTFSVSDFYGMINPYLETRVSPSGNGTYVVERVTLNEGGGYVSFVMQQYQIYTLTFICQQGSYSQTFTAMTQGIPGQLAVSLPVLAGSFISTNTTQIIAATANRTDNTVIIATYVDPSGNTTWVNIQISHQQGTTSIIDYSANVTGNSQTFTWSLADPYTTYSVTITSLSDGELYTFTLIVPSISADNPWSGIDWSWLGGVIPTLPTTYTGWRLIDPTQVIATILILFALGIGSYFSTGPSIFISWVIAGVLLAMGWWQGNIGLFVLAGVVAVLTLIDEYKKGAIHL